MALKLNEKYPGYMNAPSVDYPQGSFKNRTSPTSEDGSYFEQDWANDIQGFTQSLIQSAGVTPNGQVDKVGLSQYFDALKHVIRLELPAQSTETISGIAKIATTAVAQGFTNDLDIITSKKLADAFKGSNAGLSSSGFQRLPSGLTIQWAGGVTNSAGLATVTWPTAFKSAIYATVGSLVDVGVLLNWSISLGTSGVGGTTVLVCNPSSAGQVATFRVIAVGV